MTSLFAGGTLAIVLAGGIIAIDDRHAQQSDFVLLVGSVKELAGHIVEFRLEDRLESQKRERRDLIKEHGPRWCQRAPLDCQIIVDKISTTQGKLDRVREK